MSNLVGERATTSTTNVPPYYLLLLLPTTFLPTTVYLLSKPRPDYGNEEEGEYGKDGKLNENLAGKVTL